MFLGLPPSFGADMTGAETALGLTLMILVIIAGQEIAHLVHPAAALTVTLLAPLSVVLAARAA